MQIKFAYSLNRPKCQLSQSKLFGQALRIIAAQSPDVKQQTEQHEPIQWPVQRLQHTSQQEQVQVQKQVQQVQQELSRARAARAACRGTPAKRPEVALRGSGYCSGS